MHGHNINLPVYVCVCQLAYRSDPSTDFYNSLKYADLRKDVPFTFGGLDDE